MNKAKKYIWVLLLLTVIVVIYANLTNIVIAISAFKTTGVLEETDINSNNLVAGYYSLGTCRQTDNLIKTVEINGWAFLATNENNSGKTIELVLKNDKTGKIYKVKTDVYSRPDVYSAYSETVNIQGNNHGFSTYFSALKLPNGTYHMFLNIKENASAFGLMPTNEYFTKNNDSFTLYQSSDTVRTDSAKPATLQEVDIGEKATVSEAVKYYIDQAEAKGEYLDVQGWAFIEGQDASKTPVYLLIECNGKSAVYSTSKASRVDVSAQFNNEFYVQSGLRAEIPLKGITGNVSITIIAGKYKASSSYELTLG